MKFIKSKKGVSLLAALAVVAIAAVGAYAYFSSTGHGSGTASVGTSAGWAVTTGAATGGPLTPGGATETVAYHVKNNSTGNQQLNSVAISVANNDGTPWTAVAGCSKNDFALDAAAAGATQTDTLNVNLAPGATYDGTITVAMVNRQDTVAGDGTGNQDGCKNATVPLYLAAS
jgi:hypothetical protein